jgi:hypothetical protein
MSKEFRNLSRRPFFFPLVMPILLVVALAAVAIWLLDARATTVVLVIPHAEVDPQGAPEGELNPAGKERAARLVRMLAAAKPDRGVDAIFASENKSTQQTVLPLSETLALPINAIPSSAWPGLPGKIRREHHGEYVVVAGEPKNLPRLIESLSGQKVTLEGEELDAMFIVFVPQLAKSRVIKLRY